MYKRQLRTCTRPLVPHTATHHYPLSGMAPAYSGCLRAFTTTLANHSQYVSSADQAHQCTTRTVHNRAHHNTQCLLTLHPAWARAATGTSDQQQYPYKFFSSPQRCRRQPKPAATSGAATLTTSTPNQQRRHNRRPPPPPPPCTAHTGSAHATT